MAIPTVPQQRCSHCFMPTETTGDGAATAHDYPYAADAYGQCRGSGRPAIPGPTTPPPAWGDEPGRTWAELGVLPSPLPSGERNGWTVTLTGIRFTHTDHCPHCRQAVHIATEGGRIRIGFDRKGRSFEQQRPGARANYQGPCPNCGKNLTIGMGGSANRNPLSGLPVADAETAKRREWKRLRTDLAVTATVDMTPADLHRLRRNP